MSEGSPLVRASPNDASADIADLTSLALEVEDDALSVVWRMTNGVPSAPLAPREKREGGEAEPFIIGWLLMLFDDEGEHLSIFATLSDSWSVSVGERVIDIVPRALDTSLSLSIPLEELAWPDGHFEWTAATRWTMNAGYDLPFEVTYTDILPGKGIRSDMSPLPLANFPAASGVATTTLRAASDGAGGGLHVKWGDIAELGELHVKVQEPEAYLPPASTPLYPSYKMVRCEVTVQNGGKNEQSLSHLPLLLDGDGFAYDDAWLVSQDTDLRLMGIKPETTVSGYWYFEIPKGTSVSALVLDSSSGQPEVYWE